MTPHRTATSPKITATEITTPVKHIFQKDLGSSGIVGVILMDLSKDYDWFPHDLIIAKLEVYRLDKNSLRFLFDYLS